MRKKVLRKSPVSAFSPVYDGLAVIDVILVPGVVIKATLKNHQVFMKNYFNNININTIISTVGALYLPPPGDPSCPSGHS